VWQLQLLPPSSKFHSQTTHASCSSVLCTIPAAWACGSFRRSSLLKLHSLCAFAAIATLATALTSFADDAGRQFKVLCVGLSLMGMAQVRAVVCLRVGVTAWKGCGVSPVMHNSVGLWCVCVCVFVCLCVCVVVCVCVCVCVADGHGTGACHC